MGRLETEQMPMDLGDDFVVTFHERPEDSFDPVRHLLRNPGGQIRQSDPDYLAYG